MMTRTEVKEAVKGMLEDMQDDVKGTNDAFILLRNLRAHFENMPIKKKRDAIEKYLRAELEEYFENRPEDWNHRGEIMDSSWRSIEEEAMSEYEHENFSLVTEVLNEWIQDEMVKFAASKA